MAIEANELIPPAYVYKPVSFGSAIQNIGQSQLEAQKYKSEQAKRKDQENKRMLNVDIYATANKTFNDNLSEMRKKIIDQYSQLAAQGHNLSDPSDEAYNLFQSDLNQYKTTAEQFKGAASELKSLEITLRTSDPQIADYFIGKIDDSQDAGELTDNITEAWTAATLIAKKPNMAPIISKAVNAAGMDAVIQSIKTEKKSGKKLTIVKEINDKKLPEILSVIKADPAYAAEKKLFEFKQKNGLLEGSEYIDANDTAYTNYDEYLTAKIADAITLKDASMQQYREKSTFNFNASIGGGTTTPSQVNIPEPTKATAIVDISGSNPTWDATDGKIKIVTGKSDRNSAWGWAGNKYGAVDFDSSTGTLGITPQQLAKTNAPGNNYWNLMTTGSSSQFGSSKSDFVLPNGSSKNGYITSVKYDQFGNLWGLLDNNTDYVILYSTINGLEPQGNDTDLLGQLGMTGKITDLFKIQ
jgi:hypothetical protein